MSLLQTLEEVELAFAIEYFTAVELIAAVEAVVDATPELHGVDALVEIVRLNRKQQAAVDRAPIMLGAYLAAHPTAPEDRPRSLEACGKGLLKARLQRYLASEDLPATVCRMVSPIEHWFDYPVWLGNLYNVCDWTDEKTPREGFHEIRDEAERLVNLL